jgi:hypothetical protein
VQDFGVQTSVLALWAAFLIATEATVNSVTAPTHKTTLIAQLVSVLVIRSGGVDGRETRREERV